MTDEPAFPCTVRRNTSSDPLATPREFHMPGMSLRDWFAGQALGAAINAVASGSAPLENWVGTPAQTAASIAYIMADAMILVRSPVSDDGEAR